LVRAERLAVVGQLAAGLAHEIGNPLAVLSGYMDVLDDPELAAAERADALVRMGRELDRIQVIMRDLLDFSRAPRAAAGAGDVREALGHVEKLLRPQEKFRDVEVSVILPDDAVEVALETDALTQVLLNLLFNAADAMAGSGRVRVVVESGDACVAIQVDDSGPGVAADVVGKIFEPFYTTKAAGQGTGLGLAVCDHIVSSVGGEIALGQSELGGARFTVTLPVATAPER
jgi:signal transduction histidine kinase